MCVIAYYPKGLPFNDEELRLCFKNNPDGAGVMWQDGNNVRIHKGFMHQKALFKFLKTLPTNVDRVIHFRIATSGRVSAACCHPFPVVGDYKTMMKPELTVPVAYAHNGVLVDYTPKAGMRSSFSDTMVFGKEVLHHLLESNINLFDPIIDVMLESTIDGDRMAIMNSKETVTMGRFLTSNKSGAQYSNASYSYDRTALKSYGCESWFGYYNHTSGAQGSKATTAKTDGKKNDEAKVPEVIKVPSDTGLGDIVNFAINATVDTKDTALTGYTRDDFEDFVTDNLEEMNIYCLSVVIAEIDNSRVTFSVECMAYADELLYPLYNIYEGKTVHDCWRVKQGIRNIPVDMAVADVLFEDSVEQF